MIECAVADRGRLRVGLLKACRRALSLPGLQLNEIAGNSTSFVSLFESVLNSSSRTNAILI